MKNISPKPIVGLSGILRVNNVMCVQVMFDDLFERMVVFQLRTFLRLHSV